MKKAVILLSGGLDSSTCLALAKQKNDACFALSFSYGQKHTPELMAAKKIAQHFHVDQHEIVSLPMGHWGGSALTDPLSPILDYTGKAEIATTYVPARNTIFLALALGWAEILKAQSIFIGVSAIDYSGYPDCRPEYIEAFQKLATLATKTGVEGNLIAIEAPLLHLNKAETIALGASLGVDYSMTISCYQADANGLACGTCDSCELRKRGFKEAGVKDPTSYV
jgi:7-cyano-7-deazaguanine synthase